MAGIERQPGNVPHPKRDGGLPADADPHLYEDLYQVAYEEGRRTLDDQTDELNRMRDRAVNFAVFAGAATAFLVGTGLQAPHRDATFYTIAIIASALSLLMIALLFVLLNPAKRRRELWNYRMSPKSIITGWIETEVPVPNRTQFNKALANVYDDMVMKNEVILGSLRRAYRWLIVVGSLQVTIWAALVWIKG
jgi:hypothetical protein